MPPALSESKRQAAIVQALESLGYVVVRVHCGTSRRGQYRFRHAKAGTPDLCVPPFGWLESKTPENDLSPDQRRWHTQHRKWGGNVAVVRTPREAVEAVMGWV